MPGRAKARAIAALLISPPLILAACGGGGEHPHTASSTSKSPPRLRARLLGWRLPAPVSAEVALPDSRRLLLIGGLDSAGASSDQVIAIEPNDGAAGRWGSLSQPLHDAAGVELGGQAFVFGGGETSSYSSVETLRRGGRATISGVLPSARSDLSAVAAGRRAYVLGGYDGATLAPDVLATTDGRHFDRIASLPVPVRYSALTVAHGELFAFGGERSDGTATRAIQRIDPGNGQARVVGSLPFAIDHAAALAYQGRIWVLGGDTRAGNASRQIVSVDPGPNRVRRAGRLPVAISDTAVVRLGTSAYLLGGVGPNGLTSDRVIRLSFGR